MITILLKKVFSINFIALEGSVCAEEREGGREEREGDREGTHF